MNLVHHEDQLLIERIRKDEERAFDTIYDLYWKPLFRYAFVRVQAEDIAKDLVQEVFISLWNKKDTLVLTASLSAYLFSILRFKLIDHYDANGIRKKHVLMAGQEKPVLDNGTDYKIHANEINNLLHLSIDRLPVKMKEVFKLSRIKGYSTQQISEHLHISEQTVKNQISSVLKKLRVNFADYLPVAIICFILR